MANVRCESLMASTTRSSSAPENDRASSSRWVGESSYDDGFGSMPASAAMPSATIATTRSETAWRRTSAFGTGVPSGAESSDSWQ
jgi:hypothetical protein